MSAALAIDTRPRNLLVLAGLAVVAILIAVQPAPAAAPRAMIGLALVALIVGLWATAALPAAIAGALFFALALACDAAPPLALLSGLWSNVAALVLGGLILGGAAERTGLGRHIARALMGGMTATYPRFVAGVLIGSGVLSFLVPTTMGRLAITLPILTVAAREAGYEIGSRGYVGVILTAVAGNYMTSYGVLPSNLTNILVFGALEAQGGPVIQYGSYLLMSLPVLGFVKGLTFWAAVLLFCPAPAPRMTPAAGRPGEPMSPAARRLALLLALTVALWVTDFLHHVKPGWIALAAALVCLVPGIGLARRQDVLTMSVFTAVFSLAAVLAVATVLTHSGAGRLIAGWLSAFAPASAGSPIMGFALITLAAALIATVATVVGSIAIVTPTVPDIAAITGLPVVAGTMAVVTGLQAVFFPFEAVPIMVGLMMGKVAASATIRVLVPLALSGLLLIMPLQIAWLRLLGVMP